MRVGGREMQLKHQQAFTTKAAFKYICFRRGVSFNGVMIKNEVFLCDWDLSNLL